jgi:hypothetical protein
MNTTEITLTFNRADFEELYFKDNNEKLFLSPNTKERSLLALIFGCLFFSSLVYSLITDSNWGVCIVIFPLFAMITFNLYRNVAAIIKWKKSVNKYLNEVAAYKSHKIILSESAFSLVQDTTEYIERWSEFKKITIDEKSITLYASEKYVIPKKSMSLADYELFEKEVKEKVMNSAMLVEGTTE